MAWAGLEFLLSLIARATRLFGKLIETDFQPVAPAACPDELVRVIAHSRRNLFPVVGPDEQLLGVLLLENVRRILFNNEKYDTVKVK